MDIDQICDELQVKHIGWEIRGNDINSEPIFWGSRFIDGYMLAVSHIADNHCYIWAINKGSMLSGENIADSRKLGEQLPYHGVSDAIIACENYFSREINK